METLEKIDKTVDALQKCEKYVKSKLKREKIGNLLSNLDSLRNKLVNKPVKTYQNQITPLQNYSSLGVMASKGVFDDTRNIPKASLEFDRDIEDILTLKQNVKRNNLYCQAKGIAFALKPYLNTYLESNDRQHLPLKKQIEIFLNSNHNIKPTLIPIITEIYLGETFKE